MSMQENTMVSVVVPVYNAEEYIARCIESILAQTHENLELILVDDGSPDQSGAICDEYARIDSRVTVIHQENAGVSAARNSGINMASGKYLFFVDSDDWIASDHIENLLPTGNEDLVCGGLVQMIHNQRSECICLEPQKFTCEEWIKDFWRFWHNNGILSPCRSCYSTQILHEQHVRFNCSLRIGEDEHFNIRYIRYCNTIKFVSSCTYFYEIGDHLSAMHKWHPSRIKTAIALSSAIEDISQKPEYAARWYYWHTAIRHLDYWHKKTTGADKREVHIKLSECFNEPFFRECLPYIRKNGTLDEKIETYFMRSWLHPLYKPVYSIIVFLSKIKHYILRK